MALRSLPHAWRAVSRALIHLSLIKLSVFLRMAFPQPPVSSASRVGHAPCLFAYSFFSPTWLPQSLFSDRVGYQVVLSSFSSLSALPAASCHFGESRVVCSLFSSFFSRPIGPAASGILPRVGSGGPRRPTFSGAAHAPTFSDVLRRARCFVGH